MYEFYEWSDIIGSIQQQQQDIYLWHSNELGGVEMNIQIFGTKKCNDTKKAERFFKERGIKYQFIDMKEKG